MRDICRLFNVPVYLVGDEQRSTVASASAALSYFASNCLRPLVIRTERSFQSVLDPRYRLSIDLTALLKGDVDAFLHDIDIVV